MSLFDVVALAYSATFVTVLLIEITKSEKWARRSAQLAILLAMVAGSTWVYGAYLNRGPFNEDGWRMPARHAVAARDPEDDDSDLGPGDGRDPEERDGGRGGRGASSGAAASEGASFAEASASALQSGQRALHRAAILLGLAAEDKPDGGGIKSFKDCADCPEMVHIGAGTAEIGAADTDEEATRAERPWHTARIWPGFALSRTAVTSASFQGILRDTPWTSGVCSQSVVANDDQAASPLVNRETSIYASCVSAGDAEAYVGWLTAHTGQRYRLPTAVEWEYAASTVGSPVLRSGDVAETVADCWQDRLPQPGFENIASQSGEYDCPARMLKGGSAADDAKWRRASARRMLPHRAALVDVGFRVVRDE